MNLFTFLTFILSILIFTGTFGDNGGKLLMEPAGKSEIRIRGEGSPFNVNCKTEDISAVFSDITGKHYVHSGNVSTSGLTIRVPVEGFDCGIRGMNYDFRQTMDAKNYQAIHFDLKDTRRINDSIFTVTGDLTVSGTTNRVIFDALVKNVNRDIFHIKGETEINMSDYNLEAPSALFGWVYVEEKLTIHFSLITAFP